MVSIIDCSILFSIMYQWINKKLYEIIELYFAYHFIWIILWIFLYLRSFVLVFNMIIIQLYSYKLLLYRWFLYKVVEINYVFQESFN